MTPFLEYLQAAGALATAVGVGVAVYQFSRGKKAVVTAFEDSIAKEYRDLLEDLPVEALLGDRLDEATIAPRLMAFYRYMDLSNQEVFLRCQGRISAETWSYWRDGIRYNLVLPAFASAWAVIKRKAPTSFTELQHLESDGFATDPNEWPREQRAQS